MKRIPYSHLQLDIEFLVVAGQFYANFVSSNSLISIAYGFTAVGQQRLPCDVFDLAACETMWAILPEHRKTEAAVEAMAAARNIFL